MASFEGQTSSNERWAPSALSSSGKHRADRKIGLNMENDHREIALLGRPCRILEWKLHDGIESRSTQRERYEVVLEMRRRA